MSERITQRDIAKAMGVSHATVSLGLRDHHSISKKTKAEIRRVAKKIGYVPDPMLAGLSAYRKSKRPAPYQNNIAWLNSHKNPRDLYVGDYQEYYDGALQRCRELGYILEEIQIPNPNPGTDTRALKRILQAKGITGLVLPPSQEPGGELHLDFSRFSAVRFGYSYRHPFLHTVTNAQFRTAAIAMNHLISLGYKRIGLAVDIEVNRRTEWNFFGGFQAASQAIPEEQRVPPYGGTIAGDGKAILRWIEEHRIDCVLGHAHWICYILRNAGMRVPRDIGYADLGLSGKSGDLSGMRQNSYLTGVAAITLLDSMMQRGETGIPAAPMHVYIEGEWFDGATVRSRPPSRSKAK